MIDRNQEKLFIKAKWVASRYTCIDDIYEMTLVWVSVSLNGWLNTKDW